MAARLGLAYSLIFAVRVCIASESEELRFAASVCKTNSSKCARRGDIVLLQSTGRLSKSVHSQRSLSEQRAVLVSQVVSEAGLCAPGSHCEVPANQRWVLDTNMDVGTLRIRGVLTWDTSKADLVIQSCFIMVEDGGLLQIGTLENPMLERATIYIKQPPSSDFTDNLGKRFLASRGNARIEIHGRPLTRTMTLLSRTAPAGATMLHLKHDPTAMGWRVGDRIGVATTKARISDSSEHRIVAIGPDTITVDHPHGFERAGGMRVIEGESFEVAAEVVNMERSVVITGDHEGFASHGQGLFTMHMPDKSGATGVGIIRYARVEFCGQQGVVGRYCLHWHLLGQCPECVFQGNAVVDSFQSAITVHGAHRTIVDSNVLWMSRGVGIYVEDGNEMNNTISNNTIICPYWDDNVRKGGPMGPYCRVRGANAASESVAIYAVGMTNDFIDNHMIGHQHALFTPGNLHALGQGAAHGNVCPKHTPFGIMRGNVAHDHSYFGTYVDNQYPRNIGPRDENGFVIDMRRCWMEVTDDGADNGAVPASKVEDHFDYNNDFVGQYTAGDVAYIRLKVLDCNSGMYWKRSKNFADPDTIHHIEDSVFADSTGRLPGGPFAFSMHNIKLVGRAQLHSNQHCFGGPSYDTPGVAHQGMTCNTMNVVEGLDTTTSVYPWVRQQGNWPSLIFGSSGGDEVRALWVTPDNSLDGFEAIVSGHLNGFGLVPGCQGPFKKWGGGYGCHKPVRRLNIYGPNMGRLRIRGPGYEGVAANNDDPVYGMNAGSLWFTTPFHDPTGDYSSQGSYGAPVIAGETYTIENLQWKPDDKQPGDIVVEFSDPHVSNRFGNPQESVTLILTGPNDVTITCVAQAGAERRFFAPLKGPESGAVLGDCGRKFRELFLQPAALILERSHRRRRNPVPAPTGGSTGGGSSSPAPGPVAGPPPLVCADIAAATPADVAACGHDDVCLKDEGQPAFFSRSDCESQQAPGCLSQGQFCCRACGVGPHAGVPCACSMMQWVLHSDVDCREVGSAVVPGHQATPSSEPHACKHECENTAGCSGFILEGGRCSLRYALDPSSCNPSVGHSIWHRSVISAEPRWVSSHCVNPTGLQAAHGWNFRGAIIRTDKSLGVCTDCAVRCFLQGGGCVGYVHSYHDGSETFGDCTYFSRIDAVVRGPDRTTAIAKNPPSPARHTTATSTTIASTATTARTATTTATTAPQTTAAGGTTTTTPVSSTSLVPSPGPVPISPVWVDSTCARPVGLKVADGFEIRGTEIRTDRNLHKCHDCAVRCFLQQANCVGYVFSQYAGELSLGDCTYFSRIDSVGKGSTLTQAFTTTVPTDTASPDHYRKVDGVGGWGGICTCPSGATFNVGDMHDACVNGPASLACEGGTPGACVKINDPSRLGMKVTCAAST